MKGSVKQSITPSTWTTYRKYSGTNASGRKFSGNSRYFKQLGDTSASYFLLLCHCEECVINISALVDMSSPAVSHHLRQLKASGLIVNRRVGKEVYYKAADTEQAQLLHHMIEKLAEIACISQH